MVFSMEKELIDIIWNEEVLRFGLQNDNIYWRHGFPKDFARSYVQNFEDTNSIRVTIDDTLESEKKVRGDTRHELNHAYCFKNNLPQSEILSTIAQFFPDFVLNHYRKVLAKRESKG